MNENGFSITEVLIAMVVTSITALGLATLMSNLGKQSLAERIRASRDRLVNLVTYAAINKNALMSSEHKPGNDEYTLCRTGCPTGTNGDFTLYDASGTVKITGYYTAEGTWCSDTSDPECPLRIRTQFTASCASGPNCIRIHWIVEPNSDADPRPMLLTIKGDAPLAGFIRCPPGQFARAYDPVSKTLDCVTPP